MVGGALVAALLYLLPHLLPQETAELDAMRSQLDQLRRSVSELDQPASGELLARVEALEAGAAGEQDLPARLQAVEGAGASLGERIAALEKQTATIDTGQAGAAAERLRALEDDVRGVAATVARLRQAAPGPGAAGGQAVADLGARIDALEANLRQAGAAGAAVQELAGRVGAVEQEIAAGQREASGLADDVKSVSGQVGALGTRVDALAQTVDQLQQRIASTEERRTQAADLARAVAELDAAIEQGQPFGQVLDGLGGLDPADPLVAETLEELQPAAASGVPSLPALRGSFERIANRIVNAARAPEGGGLLERAAGNLMSLVTVRPVGADVEGDSAAARVARAEAALDAGDLAAAVAELEALKGGAAEAAAPWLAEARQRLAAEAALASLQGHATSLLTERP
jgi:hypothetical protein